MASCPLPGTDRFPGNITGRIIRYIHVLPSCALHSCTLGKVGIVHPVQPVRRVKGLPGRLQIRITPFGPALGGSTSAPVRSSTGMCWVRSQGCKVVEPATLEFEKALHFNQR